MEYGFDLEVISWLNAVTSHYRNILKNKKIWNDTGVVVVPVGETLYFSKNFKIPGEVLDSYTNPIVSIEFSEVTPIDTLYFELKRISTSEILDYIEIPTLANWISLKLFELGQREAQEVLNNYTELVELSERLTNREILQIAKALR